MCRLVGHIRWPYRVVGEPFLSLSIPGRVGAWGSVGYKRGYGRTRMVCVRRYIHQNESKTTKLIFAALRVFSPPTWILTTPGTRFILRVCTTACVVGGKGDFGRRALLSRCRWRFRNTGLRSAVGRQCGKARGTNEFVGRGSEP